MNFTEQQLITWSKPVKTQLIRLLPLWERNLDEKALLERLKSFALIGDFANIKYEIAAMGGQN